MVHIRQWPFQVRSTLVFFSFFYFVGWFRSDPQGLTPRSSHDLVSASWQALKCETILNSGDSYTLGCFFFSSKFAFAGQDNFVQLGSFLWNFPMLRLSARTFLLVFLVVDGFNLPGDLASGKLHHAHEYILGSTSHHLLVHSANWTQENWKLICL